MKQTNVEFEEGILPSFSILLRIVRGETAVAELGQLKYVQGLDPDVAEMIMYLRRIGI